MAANERQTGQNGAVRDNRIEMDTQRIGLTLPKLRSAGNRCFDLSDTRRVEAWVRELPAGNVGEMARRVYRFLHETNRHRFSWRDRLNALEALRPSADYLAQSLHSRFVGPSLPLFERQRLAGELAYELQNELALGYKIAAEELAGAGVFGGSRRALTTALHRSIHHMGRALLTRFQLYQSTPEGLWLELHRSFAYAERHLLHHTGVEDPAGAQRKTNIATAYKQVLLLALAGPNRLRPDETGQLFDALEPLSHEASIRPFRRTLTTIGPTFLVPTMEDRAPLHLSLSESDEPEGHWRLLDLTQPMRSLRDRIERSESDATAAPPIALLRKVALAWGIPPIRRFDRCGTRASIDGVVGLTAIHRALLADAPDRRFDDLFHRRAVFETRPLTKGKVQDRFDPFSRGDAVKTTRLNPDPTDAEVPPPRRWGIRDQSEGGLRLELHEETASGLQIGELVGLHLPTTPGWRPAVVRWLRRCGRDIFEVGVEFAGSGAQPTAVHRLSGETDSPYHRSLLLADGDGAVSMAVPPRLFSEGDQVGVRDAHGERRCCLESIVDSSGGFIRFRFADQSPAGEAQSTARDQDNNPERFDALWSRL